jgi:hypothetical protein
MEGKSVEKVFAALPVVHVALAASRRSARRWTLSMALTLISPAYGVSQPSLRETQCIEASARYYGLPSALLQAIRVQEGGSPGSWRRNADGSLDYGVMQINSRWLPRLTRAGYTASVLTYDACASIAAGAWILAHSLADHDAWNRPNAGANAYWRAVGDYHSHSPWRNRWYAERVWMRYQQLASARDGSAVVGARQVREAVR